MVNELIIHAASLISDTYMVGHPSPSLDDISDRMPVIVWCASHSDRSTGETPLVSCATRLHALNGCPGPVVLTSQHALNTPLLGSPRVRCAAGEILNSAACRVVDTHAGP